MNSNYNNRLLGREAYNTKSVRNIPFIKTKS